MIRSTEKITYCNGFMLNDKPAHISEIRDIFEGRRVIALLVWEQYEKQKQKLLSKNLTPAQYQSACRSIAKSLGV
ncbi:MULTISPECIES: hypothetical protein [Proteus]|uniref:hypothetical protein n=1 Tax=Proteus TaxID=583 RepID=UPI000DEB0C0B|nr:MULTISPECIES: hypothetical protein [Proteus]NBN61572.1 hypothetical protein [Proteus sp. G2639]MBW3471767.1 hypothetical protein [Proteus vulgaris]MDC9754523.1 hypothetical protein [Proteus mirabilis]RCE56271.1 hypothetical protein C6A90_02480 [Proteus mirabilis]HCD1083477.1 hypothetical protein [Proteus mirabilis]